MPENNKNKAFKRILIVILFLIAIIASFASGILLAGLNANIKSLAQSQAAYAGNVLNKYGLPRTGDVAKDVNFDLFWDVWDTLKKEYVDKSKLNEKAMFYGAIKGMVASVGDPYTVFMDPRISQEFSNDLAGTFDGIGAEIGIRNDVLTIIAPLADSPAEKAGLKAGDRIYNINGTSTAGVTVDQAVSEIRGPKGTSVTLTIMHEGSGKTKDYTIARDKIVVKSVTTQKRDDGIFVIKISSFNDDTADLFQQAVREGVKANPKGIVLDLRNNPGGYLETAIVVASAWIDQGVIVSEQFGDGTKDDFPAKGKALFKGLKTVVLVNQGSASASEIVAGALKDDGEATLVGKKTFGKGSVQTLDKFGDGSQIKVTIAKWLTPKGYNINEQGINPDVNVDITLENYDKNQDPQMDKAVEILNVK